jgi:hypothetical protein
MSVRSEGGITSVPRKEFPAAIGLPRPASGALRSLLLIGGGLQITTDDDASSPMHLNQRRKAKELRVRGLMRLF